MAEARRSSETFAAVDEDTGGLARFLDLVHAARWLDLDDAIAACLRGDIEDSKTELGLRRLRDQLRQRPVALGA